jgi:protein ImuB
MATDLLWLAIRLPAPLSSLELKGLACWAGSFTPRVSLAPPQGLLLEIGGCRRLFGGLDRLKTQVAQGLTAQGLAAAIAVAPTPQAALWLAEGNGDGGGNLDALLLSRLSWPGDTAARLARFGLRTLGEVRKLPAAALGRRLGKEAMAMIGRAYNDLPDPRPDFVFPPRFHMALELPAPVEHAAALLFAGRRLTAALAGWLNARQAGLRECLLNIEHRGCEATVLPLCFAAATRDAARLERVLRERLERLVLPAPAESLALVATEVEPLAGHNGDLFDAGGDGTTGEAMAALVERLRARLGEERVHGISIIADHRPECANRCNSPDSENSIKKHAGPPQVFLGPLGGGRREAAASGGAHSGPRPFWLLAKPEPLPEQQGRPQRRGPVKLLAGPERIESGWWDDGQGVGDQRRDYFIALTADDRWAWVFRELRSPGGWFLHGWFG